MDTLIIIALLLTLCLFYFRPKQIFGQILYGLTWTVTVLLFISHITSPLNLNF